MERGREAELDLAAAVGLLGLNEAQQQTIYEQVVRR